MEKKLYACTCAMDGDKFYQEGDPREAVPVDVAHLVASGALREPTDEDRKRWERAKVKPEKPVKKTKVEQPAQTKAEPETVIQGALVVDGPVTPASKPE